MAVHVKSLTWTDCRCVGDLVESARDVEYVVLEHHVGTFSNASPKSTADVIVVTDRSNPAVQRLRQLPPILHLIVTLPEYHPAVAIAAKTLEAHADIVQRSQSASELIVRLTEAGTVSCVESSGDVTVPVGPLPSLTTPTSGPRTPWMKQIIERLRIPGFKPSPAKLSAFNAGLFLIHDFFDESHSCSQSLEGRGEFRTGDYWHAILHRREPDYGNSKYWFRSVGRHPAFAKLVPIAEDLLSTATGRQVSLLERWRSKIISGNAWDPFAFVDLCEAAENDVELGHWCERLQYEEMLLLLESSYLEAAGAAQDRV